MARSAASAKAFVRSWIASDSCAAAKACCCFARISSNDAESESVPFFKSSNPALMMFSSDVSEWCSVACWFASACALLTLSIFVSMSLCFVAKSCTAVRMVSRSV